MGLIFNLHPIHFCRCLSFIFIRSLNPPPSPSKKIADFLSRCRGQMRSFIASLLLSSCISVFPSIHDSDYIISRVSGKLARPLTEGQSGKHHWGWSLWGGEKKKGLRHSVSKNFHCESPPTHPPALHHYNYSSFKAVSSENVLLYLIASKESNEEDIN